MTTDQNVQNWMWRDSWLTGSMGVRCC